MKPHSRANRVAFRRAVGASALLHIVAACAFVWVVRSNEEPKPAQLGIDTLVTDEPQVRMHLVEDTATSVEVRPQPVPQPNSAKPADTPSPAPPAKPFATVPPRSLPDELLTLLRKPSSTGATAEVPIQPNPTNVGTDPNVKPASGTSGAKSVSSVQAFHGAFKPNQTVVYVLDCSGSMGAGGKFDAARAALLATLQQQPPTVRFQIIVYAREAAPLLASDGSALLANEANLRLAASKLAALAACGKSNHLPAISAALRFHPEVIVLLTDAEELTAATLKPVLAASSRSTPVFMGHVTDTGVQSLRELK